MFSRAMFCLSYVFLEYLWKNIGIFVKKYMHNTVISEMEQK